MTTKKTGYGIVVVVSAVAMAFVSLLLMVGSLATFRHYSDQLNEVAVTNCANIENLKAGQREGAQATIDGDLAFLKAHPGGTPDFPEAVVRADIAAKQKTVDRFAAKECPDP